MVGGWNGLLLGQVRSQDVPCRFCGAPDGDGHLFWERLIGQGACSGMAGFLCFQVLMVPRLLMLLRVLSIWLRSGRYSHGLVADWSPPGDFDAVGAASLMPDDPNVWTDGSLVLDQVTGVSSSTAAIFAHQSQDCWGGCRWVMLIMFVLRGRCSLVGAFVLFFSLCNQFRELRCGVSFWLCSLLQLCIWELTIWGGSSCWVSAGWSSWFHALWICH